MNVILERGLFFVTFSFCFHLHVWFWIRYPIRPGQVVHARHILVSHYALKFNAMHVFTLKKSPGHPIA